MILPDYKIREWASNGGITPFAEECINPASIDLRWSGRQRQAFPNGWGDVYEEKFLDICPGDFYLLDTLETVHIPNNWSGQLQLKSSMGRTGMNHIMSGYVDPEFYGTLTLEIYNPAPWPITITRGQRIVQMVLHKLCAPPDKSYAVTGRYNGQSAPEPAREEK